MATFQLRCDVPLQGTFNWQARNLLFVFQVNCPGCFLYGFPLVNLLHHRYQAEGLNVLGLSTAFEDFDLNTAANTELLLTEKKTVGATQKALGDRYAQVIDFPIAMDQLTTGKALATTENIDLLSERIAGFTSLSQGEQTAIRQQVRTYLENLTQTSATFALNQLPGTPTFLLLDQNLQVLDGWFGHLGEAEVMQRVEKCLQFPGRESSIPR